MGEDKEKDLKSQPSASGAEQDSQLKSDPQKRDHPTEEGKSILTPKKSTSAAKEDNPIETYPKKADALTDKKTSIPTTSASPSPEQTSPHVKSNPANANLSQEKISNSAQETLSSSEKINDQIAADSTAVAAKASSNTTSEKRDGAEDEIDNENAEDAEDTDNKGRHSIPLLDYESMSMENLVGEFQKLVRNEKVQAIKKQVDGIKREFDQKFEALLEEKKEKFIDSGGSEIDFKYNSNTKRQFNEVYKDYREKRDQYYKSREKNLKANLAERMAIIEELKGLTNIEEDMGSTYKTFKSLQQKWRSAGPIPRDSYNNTWRTYRHHVEIFYDFLHLNRELRDLDFKHNLEEKEKLVQRAEALAEEPDINRVFRELQALHKIWKEEVGPVDQEHREEIWERFSKATKVLHQKRQQHFDDLEKTYESNLGEKRKIIDSIALLSNDVSGNHKALQKQMKQLEELRTAFFALGKVPRNQNKNTWTAFKDAVRAFNRKKNAFYKNLKQEQQENLDKKRALLQLANQLKDSDEFEAATPEMKRIQAEWKEVGHVPRKYSDKIWKEFKKACNHYFDRLHALKNKGLLEEEANFKKKSAFLEEMSAFKPSGDQEKDVETAKAYIKKWKGLGRVPIKKKYIDKKFDSSLDSLLKKMNLTQKEAELLKYGSKIQRLSDSDNDRAIDSERSFIRKKIGETQGEIRQLETNLQFFSNVSEDNPMVRDVIKKVEVHKESLAVWEAKLKRLNIMENRLNREADEENTETEVPDSESQGAGV